MSREIAELIFPGLALGGFKAIVADPPWRFQTYGGPSENAETGRGPDYPTMSLGAIKSLPVAELAAPDCVLFLWVTDPYLERGFEVIREWGFTFKTVGLYWAKLRVPKGADPLPAVDDSFPMGNGYWTRANPETCLLATRGRPKRLSASVRRLVVAPRREHSRKPDESLDRVEALVEGPYVELFSRRTRPGWSAWGADSGIFDEVAA